MRGLYFSRRQLRSFSGSSVLPVLLMVSAAVSAADSGGPDANDKVDYAHDVRPILSDNCFACHGPDENSREGGFRLDQKESAMGEADSGEIPVVAGKPAESELLRRILSTEEWEQMPPPDSGKSLTKEEMAVIRKWIEQGAPWQQHWAFVAPQKPALPKVKNTDWGHNEIDAFILARLEKTGLTPNDETDRRTLCRRVSLDLTGIPPTPDEVEAFVADQSPDAYEKLVDRLLASPRYGEHMARYWLDAARYGDTHGLHLDNYREMWPYRDWVVSAFNENLPFDQFTTWQLAGDLLENPTREQLIATGFNRCHVTTNEGGSIQEEVYVRNVVDRVVTTGTVFMGLTMDCTRCHDHKYDPLTMKDFYSSFAFFNSLDGPPMDGNRKDPAPVLKAPTSDQLAQVDQIKRQIENIEAEIDKQSREYPYKEPSGDDPPDQPKLREVVWIDDQLPAGASPSGPWNFVEKPVQQGKKSHTQTATGRDQHYFTSAKAPLEVADGDMLFTYVFLDEKNPPRQIMLQWNDGSWEHRAYWGENLIEWGADGTVSRKHLGDLPEKGQWVRLEVPADAVGLGAGAKINGWAFTQFDGTVHWDKSGIVTSGADGGYRSLKAWVAEIKQADMPAVPDNVWAAVNTAADNRTAQQTGDLKAYFVSHVYDGTRDIFDPQFAQMEALEKQITQIEKQAPTTLVFREKAKPKPAYLLNRGEYDQRKDEVPRAVPGFLPPLPEGAPLNRLGYAQWLLDPAHPLTARVTVNRLWQRLFGIGIVKTSEDFGSQGEPPSHPQLLDWLAVQFREDGWDVKRMMKRLVMSAAYRQECRLSKEKIEIDPENRLLASGPRFRLDAEVLRDQALFASGLLVEKVGGPSVKPPQPLGLWFAVGYSRSNTVRFQADQGPEKVHRRTLYTFLKRTSPPPQMSTFGAPNRESCVVRRERTNSPLQALLLLNDPQYFEAARALAERGMNEGGESAPAKIAAMFELASLRPPTDEETKVLTASYEDHLSVYQEDVEAAKKVISVGESVPDPELDPAQLAAMTLVANTILNLDEVLCKN